MLGKVLAGITLLGVQGVLRLSCVGMKCGLSVGLASCWNDGLLFLLRQILDRWIKYWTDGLPFALPKY